MGDPTKSHIAVGAALLAIGVTIAFASWRTAEAMTPEERQSTSAHNSYDSRIMLAIEGLVLGGFGAGVLVSGVASGRRPEFRLMGYCPFCGLERTSFKTPCPRCGKNLRF